MAVVVPHSRTRLTPEGRGLESGPLSRFLGAGAFCEKGGEKEAPEEGGAGEGEGGGLEVAAECDEDGEVQDGEGEDVVS